MTSTQPPQELPELPYNGPWKQGNEFLPYHPKASHIEPDHRDGWNACYWACIAASQAGRAEAGMSTLTEVEAYKIFLFASLKKDCERPNGITAGKKIKYSVADNLLLLSVRYPSLAEAMK